MSDIEIILGELDKIKEKLNEIKTSISWITVNQEQQSRRLDQLEDVTYPKALDL